MLSGIERLIVAAVLLATGLLEPCQMLLPASVVACVAVVVVEQSGLHRMIVRFTVTWLPFFALVGAGRFFAGVPRHELLADASSSLGLALAVSCAMLVIFAGHPRDILLALDRLRASRRVTYALLALLRLLPQIRSLGLRQVKLLELKGLYGGSFLQRIRAYRRIVGPLFSVLLTQQTVHALSLQYRGFFTTRLSVAVQPKFTTSGMFLIGVTVFNALFWAGVSIWRS